jgi:hypothetical protein
MSNNSPPMAKTKAVKPPIRLRRMMNLLGFLDPCDPSQYRSSPLFHSAVRPVNLILVNLILVNLILAVIPGSDAKNKRRHDQI